MGLEPRRLRGAGRYVGQPYLKPRKLAENLYTVGARRAAEDAASARKLLCSALLFVYVADFALTEVKY